MKDKIVLVTGSGRGIGKAIALRFGQLGAKVVVNDINPDT
ncbi:MAG: SDR family NAD(P)-dependent oxidoreductase, partial [Chloroflexota bacterium]